MQINTRLQDLAVQLKIPLVMIFTTLILSFLVVNTNTRPAGATIITAPTLQPELVGLSLIAGTVVTEEQNRITRWCVWIIDPFNVEEFQLDFEFTTGAIEFDHVNYLNGFVEVTPPDLTELSSGLIMDITGFSSDPVEGNVDIFELWFKVVDSFPTTGNVFASENDFIVGFDPDTQDRVTFDSTQIEGAIFQAHVPEPTTVALLGIGLVEIEGVEARRKWKKKLVVKR